MRTIITILMLVLVSNARAAEIAALKNWGTNDERLNQKCEILNKSFGTQIKCKMDQASWKKILTPEWFETTGESMSYAGVAADRCDMAMTDLGGNGRYSCFVSTQPSKVACKNQIAKTVKTLICKGVSGTSSLALSGGALTINAGKDAGQDIWDLVEVKRLFPECNKVCH